MILDPMCIVAKISISPGVVLLMCCKEYVDVALLLLLFIVHPKYKTVQKTSHNDTQKA